MPPPPPPPPGGLPKAKPVAIDKLGGGNPGDGRAALLSSIQKGAKLKKTVTVDKSGPVIAGKVSGSDTPKGATSSPARSVGSNNSNTQNASPPGNRFGGGSGGPLNFQDELASRLGRRNNNNTTNAVSRNDERPTEISQKSSPIAELKFKQSNGRLPNSSSSGSLSNEPIANQSSLFNNSNNSNNNATVRSQNFTKSKAALEGLFGGPPAPSININNSSNVGASINLQSQPLPQPPQPVQSTPKPHSYNKPNLAPKPPCQVNTNTVNQAPSVPANQVTRHQSMRTPKSPPAAQPPFNPQFTMENHMGTMRVNKPQKMAETINSKPIRPPNKPPPPPPPTRQTPHLAQQSNLNTVNARSQNAINEFGKSPQLQMRPVVSANNLNDSENQAPPAPPHRVCPAPPVNMRSHPQMMQSDSPPAPPKRGSSMSASKKIIDLESKFQFHNVTEFPQPKPFMNLTKTYPSRATLRQSNGGM